MNGSINILKLLLSLTPLIGFSQSTINDSIPERTMNKDLVIVSGYKFKKEHFLEVGIGIRKQAKATHHTTTMFYGISSELNIINDFILGTKASFWIGGSGAGIEIGANLIHYTDFDENSFQIRPEVGIGSGVFRLTYGYNLPISIENFDAVGRHVFGFNILFNAKSIKL